MKDEIIPGCRLFSLDETDSTNTYAKSIIDAVAGNFAVTARSQTAGRGRRGKSFFSPEGGIYISFVTSSRCNVITPAAAVAVCRTIRKSCGIEAGIKWVNDIFVDGKKVCGILCEAVGERRIIGIGINCKPPAQNAPESLQRIAGYIKIPVSKAEFTEALARELFDVLRSEEREIIAEYRRNLFVLGREVFLSDGTSAQALDVSESGELIVRLGNGEMKTLNSGEISITFPFPAE